MLTNLVRPYLSVGRTQEAWDLMQRIYERARRTGDRPAEQSVLIQLGLAAMGQAAPQQAAAYFDAASQIARERGDGRGESSVVWHAAICEEAQGNRERALQALAARCGSGAPVRLADRRTLCGVAGALPARRCDSGSRHGVGIRSKFTADMDARGTDTHVPGGS